MKKWFEQIIGNIFVIGIEMFEFNFGGKIWEFIEYSIISNEMIRWKIGESSYRIDSGIIKV